VAAGVFLLGEGECVLSLLAGAQCVLGVREQQEGGSEAGGQGSGAGVVVAAGVVCQGSEGCVGRAARAVGGFPVWWWVEPAC